MFSAWSMLLKTSEENSLQDFKPQQTFVLHDVEEKIKNTAEEMLFVKKVIETTLESSTSSSSETYQRPFCSLIAQGSQLNRYLTRIYQEFKTIV